jgi:zinc protease
MTAISAIPQKARAFPGVVHTLPSGLTAILQHVPTAAAVTCDIWVRTGARTEPESLSGVSHFLEHMIFKGTEKLGPGVFDYEIESRGGATNAATSQDYTHYYITVANEHFQETLPYLAELVLNAAIPPDEYERERLVVLEEIRRSQDSTDRQAYDILSKVMYPVHPYGRPVLGTADHLLAMSADQMRAYHRERYQPANTTVVIVGGVSETEMLAAVQKEFASFTTTTTAPIPTIAQPDRPKPETLTQHLPRLEQPRLMLSWLGAPIGDLEEAIALEVLGVILSEGRTSRLVRSLREEKGWVRSIHAYFMPQQQPGLFLIAAQADAEFLDPVEAEIRETMQAIIDEGFSEQELERAVRMLRNDFIFNTESPSQLAGLYGYYSTLASLDLALDYPQQLKKVTTGMLKSVARQYLAPEQAVVLRLLPEA